MFTFSRFNARTTVHIFYLRISLFAESERSNVSAKLTNIFKVQVILQANFQQKFTVSLQNDH